MGVPARVVQVWLSFCLLALTTAAKSPIITDFRGISPLDEAHYRTDSIKCKDGSASFSLERLNDDFCDCADGTDEPGTSACPGGKFYCKNKGHTPLEIFSSRVNDGICDCCDGSDEYEGKIKCSNTCSQAGKVLKEKLEKKIATFKAGLEIRKRDVEHAKHMVIKEKSDISALKQEEKKLKDQVQKLKVKKEAIEKAEQEDKAQKEREEEARKTAEAQDTLNQEKEKASEKEELSSLDDTKLVSQEKAEDLDKKLMGLLEEQEHAGLSKEELGRLVASRWTGENPNTEEIDGKDDDKPPTEDEDAYYGGLHEDEDEPSAEDEDEPSAEDEDEDDDEKVPEDDSEVEEEPHFFVSTDDGLTNDGPWWARLKNKLKDFSTSIIKPFKSPVDMSEADAVRKDYKESSARLSEIQSKISDLEKKLEQDFGKDGEYYSLYGQCHELQIKKYTYKVCPFRNAVQMEGHSTTTLGNWDGFKDDYKSMHFVRGDKCWNGPDRSLKVRLRCSSKVELRDVDEPSRCEYAAELYTPAACLEGRLKLLEQRLHNQEEPHDEL